MISLSDYAGPRLLHPEFDAEAQNSAQGLLIKVNAMLLRASREMDWAWPVDKDTGTCVSGSAGGSGDGGWRPSESKTGAPGSQHRRAHAVDVFDPGNRLDAWLTDEILAEHGLYREHPDSTPGWCHLQDVAPGSQRRTFRP